MTELTPGERDGRQGFALIGVLWALVFVGAVAAAYLAESVTLARMSANRSAELRARAAAVGEIEIALNRLRRLNSRTSRARAAAAVDDRVAQIRAWNDLATAAGTDNARCERRICVGLEALDLGTRINVNRAGEQQLRRFLRYLGIAGWRAEQAALRISAAIHPGLRSRGVRPPMRDTAAYRPARTVDELRRRAGLSEHVFRRARDYLTTNGRGHVNVNAAPGPVLAALPGLSAEGVEVVLRARREGVTFRGLRHLIDVVDASGGGGAGADLRRSVGSLMRWVVVEPADVMIVASARPAAGPPEVRMRAVLAREGAEVIVLERARLR